MMELDWPYHIEGKHFIAHVKQISTVTVAIWIII